MKTLNYLIPYAMDEIFACLMHIGKRRRSIDQVFIAVEALGWRKSERPLNQLFMLYGLNATAFAFVLSAIIHSQSKRRGNSHFGSHSKHSTGLSAFSSECSNAPLRC
jgi:hypothetical protein